MPSSRLPHAAPRLLPPLTSGNEDVYAIQRESGPEGVPPPIVRTRNPDTDDTVFQKQRESVVSFLAGEEGTTDRGYLMDVFGPDGSLPHRLDARP